MPLLRCKSAATGGGLDTVGLGLLAPGVASLCPGESCCEAPDGGDDEEAELFLGSLLFSLLSDPGIGFICRCCIMASSLSRSFCNCKIMERKKYLKS